MSVATHIIDTAASDIPSAKLIEHEQVRSVDASDSLDIKFGSSWYRVSGSQSSADELFCALVGIGFFENFSRRYTLLGEDILVSEDDKSQLRITKLAEGEEIEPFYG